VVDIIDTGKLMRTDTLTPHDSHQVYCGLDSCVTLEVRNVLEEQVDEHDQLIYGFERALQAPVLEVMLRGILTDEYEVNRLLGIYNSRKKRVRSIINEYSFATWGKGLNPGSPKQLNEYFYDYMGLLKQYKFERGVRKITTNRDALETLSQYRYARPMCNAILLHRDISKKIGVLNSGIDKDGRMRFAYNIGGTNTGRLSSSTNVFGGGTNGQNITDELRRIFVAEEGRKFGYFDLEQAESRLTAYVAGDENYIDACESGDLHVAVARDIWPELKWSLNKDPSEDRTVSEQKFFRHWTYRDLAKRGGHLTNYVGGPRSNAKTLHISQEVMSKFQNKYLIRSFPGIRRMHGDVSIELQTSATIITPLGRRRLFFGRTWDDDVLRKGVAYRPQSSVGDILNLGMWRVWKYAKYVILLAQLHDAILFSYSDDPETERKVIKEITALMIIPIQVTAIRKKNPKTRTMIIPVDATVGWNWAKYDKDTNPDGVLSYEKSRGRTRQVSPGTSLLKRIM